MPHTNQIPQDKKQQEKKKQKVTTHVSERSPQIQLSTWIITGPPLRTTCIKYVFGRYGDGLNWR